jgi:hypothetical protein
VWWHLKTACEVNVYKREGAGTRGEGWPDEEHLGVCPVGTGRDLPALAWGISGEFPIHLEALAFAQQQGGGCTTLTGIEVCGDQQSNPERLAGQSFEIAFEADNPGETDGYAFFNVIDENDGIVQPASQDLSSDSPTRVEGEVTFSSDPGEYVNGVATEEASYGLTVENCDGLSAVQTASQRPVALPRTGQAETRRLLEAGGPTDGPVPTMPDGGWPKEYPFGRSCGCHA